MTIEALPQKTIRAIGSTSAISDPCSVVKELVDNALDASATSLQVEISENTVDVIQLKDNGHGISPEDQQNVCKRAFTSKIQSLDDLKNVGGSSLGFRGEALASVAEMSGLVTVTTRVESEVAGRCLKYGRNGELTGYVDLARFFGLCATTKLASQNTTDITSCGHNCSYRRISQAYTCPQADYLEGCCKKSYEDQETSPGLRYSSTVEEVLIQSPQDKR